ncbi:MAG TPA: hypothetical protein VKT77_05055, partial [Chthonomonadaceae bacterium]|nr:hypothetical protein [Chthonomonadaceae bacterium]
PSDPFADAPPSDPFADAPPSNSLADPRPSVAVPRDDDADLLYAIVVHAGTGSAEPGRRAVAYGLDEAELKRQQPQIFDLLSTEFSAVYVGYARGGQVRAGTPPRPARLHASVWECDGDEVRQITARPDFLRALVAAPPAVPVDDLIVACLRRAAACHADAYGFLVRAGRQLAALLHDQPDRVLALLDRLQP